jgi:hypothetical protein
VLQNLKFMSVDFDKESMLKIVQQFKSSFLLRASSFKCFEGSCFHYKLSVDFKSSKNP